MDVELVALDDRRDQVALCVLDHDRGPERQEERSRAVEGGDREQRDTSEPRSRPWDQLSERNHDRERDGERDADQDESAVRHSADDRHHDHLRAEIHADAHPDPVEDQTDPPSGMRLHEREDECTKSKAARHEEQRDDEDAEQIEEDREEIAGQGGGAIARTVEDRVPEP